VDASNKQVADRLGISEVTVKADLQLFRELKITDRQQLAVLMTIQGTHVGFLARRSIPT
jgi:DNA-binding NarL/FixJ family response regulator